MNLEHKAITLSRRAVLLGAGAAGAGILAAPSLLRAEGRIAVKLAGTNLTSSAPMFVAQKLGYFSDEGLDVDVLESASGNASVSSLLGGSVDAAVTGFVIPFQVAEKGMRLQTLAGLMMKNFYVFVIRLDLDVPEDDPKALAAALKGKRFGVSNLGSAGDSIASGVLADNGLDSGDIVKVAVGVGATALAALRTGGVDALITYEPDASQIVASGAGRIALDLRTTQSETLFSRLPSTAFQATRDWVEANPDTAAALVKGITRANNLLREDVDQSIAVLSQLYPNIPITEVRAMHAAEHAGFRSAVPRESFVFTQDMYLKMGAISQTFAYEDLIATRFAHLWT